ncbi:MAG: hypothetical protein QOK29_2520 [Rhodospirillaceae bacterium]|jgi:hypothetical protein|nr:hypothetical protein [Rhodospirillaceae bacterium]
MSGICDRPIDHPAAWRADSGDGIAPFVMTLDAGALAAIDECLRPLAAAGRRIADLQATDFANRALAAAMRPLKAALRDGRGLVLLRGLPAERYDTASLEMIFWGLGTHLGTGVSQSVLGDRLGHVKDVTDVDPHARAYRNRDELTLHTDLPDIVGMMCVRPARAGGVSRFASALSLHNAILAARPDLLPALYRGYPYHRLGEHGPGQSPVTPHRVPVFSLVDGVLSIRYTRTCMDYAARLAGENLPADLVAAMDLLDELGRSPEYGLETRLEAGDMVFLNNYLVLHARSAFEDHPEPERKRLLLRLWLDSPGFRPVSPHLAIYEGGDGGRGGIEQQAGRQPSFSIEEATG